MPRYRETRGLKHAWLKIEKKARQSQHKDRNSDYQGYNSHVFELKVIRHKKSFHVQFECRVERLLGKTPRRSNNWIDPGTRSDLRVGILAAEPIGLAVSVVGGQHRGQPWPDAGPFHRLSPRVGTSRRDLSSDGGAWPCAANNRRKRRRGRASWPARRRSGKPSWRRAAPAHGWR